MIKVGSLVKMKWGYSPVGVVTKVTPHSVYGNLIDMKMVRIVWSDDDKSSERERDLEVLDESR
jgi:hypothetical protein